MFELELISLLNEINKIEDRSEFIKIENSIANLIDQNKINYAKFLETQNLDEKTQKILNNCEDILLHKAQENKPKENDFEIIKNYYKTWQEEYENNNKIPNQKCENIINQIIGFYALNRMEVIEQLFKVKDTQNFEDFKMMLKNYLRNYFALQIEEYYDSEQFNQKGFFEKRRKKKEIKQILNEIGKYEFNIDNINGVINN